jgi:hypothetical protein
VKPANLDISGAMPDLDERTRRIMEQSDSRRQKPLSPTAPNGTCRSSANRLIVDVDDALRRSAARPELSHAAVSSLLTDAYSLSR